MVFNFRETVRGIRHLGLKWMRVAQKRPAPAFLSDFAGRGIMVEQYREPNGNLAVCEVCGYSMIRVESSNGWLLEMCSAMPAVQALGSEEFANWQAQLGGQGESNPRPYDGNSSVTNESKARPHEGSESAMIDSKLPTTRV